MGEELRRSLSSTSVISSGQCFDSCFRFLTARNENRGELFSVRREREKELGRGKRIGPPVNA